ncbi:S-layer homology domain-containing protein [Sedimentibacter hydroxybenzoicus DSM 7310]|uniref:chitinase n=1 Tax=Sedimentibacter hydroxybenzoicus DSM 7310 TaxID=1123245 RepID=A0A974BK82_SEDHY|nr:glycosyl hydrolase family 18 protein [Sedimentibacter hydroxybenzoicus]NYB74396.1 S-layer homology domain-containing protein [Sedimentibacter hydroxybenzoicus DSM 7310]
MKKIHIGSLIIFLSIIFMTTFFINRNFVYGDENKSGEYKVVGYYTAWSSYSGFTPDRLDAKKLTHINYAFANIQNNEIVLGYPDKDPSNFKKLNELKLINPDLKILLSVGGWNWSGKFSDAAETESSRTAFAESCVDIITKYNIDGVDLDWEYPVGGGLSANANRASDKENFTLLLEKIREKLDRQGKIDNKHYLLSIAGGASSYYLNNIEPDKIHQYIDYANIMTYDIRGSWDTYTDFNSPLYNNTQASPQYKWSIDASAKAWEKSGFPKEKIVIGVPFYGYLFNAVKNDNNGLYQSFHDAKAISFNTIIGYLNDSGYKRYYDYESMVPWLFNGSSFISYDDEQSISSKADYIKSNNLGGVMIWELSHDPDEILLNALAVALKSERINLLTNHWAEETVRYLYSLNIINNLDTLNPENPITRSEFAEYITRALKIEKQDISEPNKFSDINTDGNASEAIGLAVQSGIVEGYTDGTFKPNNYITRQEAMVMYSRAMDYAGITFTYDNRIDNYSDKYEVADWAYPYVKKVLSSKIFNGISETSISPLSAFKHAEAAAAIKNLLEILK